MLSILILDVSGSMRCHYSNLINMANNIIQKQHINQENKVVVILFGDIAKTIINGEKNY
jgi:hypothetical protein